MRGPAADLGAIWLPRSLNRLRWSIRPRCEPPPALRMTERGPRLDGSSHHVCRTSLLPSSMERRMACDSARRHVMMRLAHPKTHPPLRAYAFQGMSEARGLKNTFLIGKAVLLTPFGST